MTAHILVTASNELVTRKCLKKPSSRHRSAHQYNRISRHTVSEHWNPKTEDLSPLKVVREIPLLYILLSKDPLQQQQQQKQQEQKPLKDFLNLPREPRKRRSKNGGSKSAA